MTERLGHKLGVGRKPVLSSIGLLALAVPVAVGFANASRRPAESQTSNPAHSNEYEVASIRPRSESGGMVSWGFLADGFIAKNVTLQWTPDESRAPMFKGTEGGQQGAADNMPSPEASGPSIFAALEKGSVDILVIDHAEKPSEKLGFPSNFRPI